MTDHEDFARQHLRANSLLDCYGALLTEKQRNVAELYYRDDLSLSEISDMLGISRQGVLDSIHRSLKILEKTDEKLGFLSKEEQFAKTASAVRALMDDPSVPDEAKRRLSNMIGEI